MGIIDRMLNHFGYELYVKPVEEILDSKKRKEFEKYPWIYRAHIIKTRKSSEDVKPYRIGMAQGAALEDDGKIPQIHGISRLMELKYLLDSNLIDSAIVSGGLEANYMAEYCIEKLGFPREKLEVDGNSWSIIKSMYNFVRNNKRGNNVELHYVIQGWARLRAEFDASWVLPDSYSCILHSVWDGRGSSEVLYDTLLEKTNLKVDRLSRALNYLKIRPDYAQVFATALVSPRLALQRFGERILPLRK